MDPQIHLLHQSTFYRIRNYKCNCDRCHISPVEFHPSFSFCFVRSGFFEYRIFRRDLEVHVGRVLVCKPFFEHTTRHIDHQPDICSVFDFKPSFYDQLKEQYGAEAGWFFSNPDIHSLLINSTPKAEYLHQCLFENLHSAVTDHLWTDDLVLQLIDGIMATISNRPALQPVPDALKKHHLSTVEKAKTFLLRNFEQNIGLQELADHCCVSLFHLSRIFKTVMQVSPHQYLQQIRLNHAQLLLKNTPLTVTEVALQSGFNSLEYFTTTFKRHFAANPSSSRKTQA